MRIVAAHCFIFSIAIWHFSNSVLQKLEPQAPLKRNKSNLTNKNIL